MEISNSYIFSLVKKTLKPESSFFWISIIYGLAISILSLAVPLSVQFLINSISFTSLLQPAFALGFVLLLLLSFWATLNALQFFTTEIFQRRFFARMASEITLSLIKSKEKNIQKSEMVNRFFETITIQKIVPKFLTKTFTTLLQGFVGLILVSFYHPFFFIFSVIIILLLWLIWSRYSKKAVQHSINKSKIKYELVHLFEDIVKSDTAPSLAAENKINLITGEYIIQRKKRFSSLFSQVTLLLILYITASVSLLILGSWLVLKGQLTIGQLVAAELVLSSVLYSFSQLGRDFENFYDLVASCEKLSQFYDFEVNENDLTPFTNLKAIALPKPLKTLPRLLIYFILILALILTAIPWQQTSKGIGHLIASDPNNRAQSINAPISGRIKKWYVRDGSIVKKGDKLVEIVDNDPQILQRIQSERDAKKRKLNISQIASQTAKINYERQEELFNKGLSSRKDFEQAKIEYKKLLSSEESAASELAESETKLSRQSNQIITAPKDGVIVKVLSGDMATVINAGDKIASFAPELDDPSVEIYVSGNDIALIREGSKVRLQFEGWPIIQFSGWPSIAVGTFGGVVSSIDPSISENGKFRVIVKKEPNEEWPNQRFLRHGAKAQAWILLNKVSMIYEIWRQLNGFPPSFDEELKPQNKKQDF